MRANALTRFNAILGVLFVLAMIVGHSETGDFYMQGETVNDPDVLAWVNSDSRIRDSGSVVVLPARMAAIILEAADGSYERGRRRFSAGRHPRPGEDVRSRREGTGIR